MKFMSQNYFQRNFQFMTFVATSLLFIISSGMSIKVMRDQKRPLVIAIDQNSTRIVSDVNDPIYQTEAISFIKRFLKLTYNFDHTTFLKQVGSATSMMSGNLWAQQKGQILDLKSKVEKQEISIKSEIEKLSKDQDKYFALIQVMENSRLAEKPHLIKVTITLNKTDRTLENPWGLEVKSYDETPLNN